MKRGLLIIFLLNLLQAKAQKEFSLYGNAPIPNSRSARNQEEVNYSASSKDCILVKVSRPTLTAYLPPAGKRNGTSVIICPGGAYRQLSIKSEGSEVAKWLTSLGITAFVLKYRLPSDETMLDRAIGPLQDAQKAIQMIRRRSLEWELNADRIGILGFSAGGHLASTAGTHFTQITIDNKDSISLRPDFIVLIYPVISLADSICHPGSRDSLLGISHDSHAIYMYSNERQVTEKTPPTFIVHCEDDELVTSYNSLYFYEALLKNHVQAELVIYPKGGHGFGMRNSMTKDEWTERLKDWLDSNGWLSK